MANSEIEVDSALALCLLPKLILQPLVENAIEHRIGSASGEVRLSVHRENTTLIIIVQDRGGGMSAEKLASVSGKIYAAPTLNSPKIGGGFEEAKKGVALRNVHQRIRLLYGEP